MITTGDATYRRWLAGIVFAAVLVRLALHVFSEFRPAMFDFPDSHRYVRVARNIAAGSGPIDDARHRSNTDPLYPIILSAAPLAGIESQSAILRFGRICNSAFSIASVLLLAAIGRRLFDARVGLIAAGIFAVDPILLFFNALVLTESLYILLLLGACYSILRLSDIPGATTDSTRPAAWALLAGVCAGLATLTRSTSLFFPIALAAFVPWAYRRNRIATGMSGFFRFSDKFLLATILVLAPTLIRNYNLFHALVPARIGGGASLMEALGPWADGSPGMDRIQYPHFPPDADEFERDRICREAAIDWAYSHPRETLSLALAKLKRTWSITIHAADYASPLIKLVCWLTVAPEFALAAAGIWLNRRRPAILALLLAPAVYFTLIHMVFVGSVRYRVPAMPLLFILAATALAQLLSKRLESRPH